MSFDMNPADEDPHHDCKREYRALQDELSMVRTVAREDNIRAEMADTYERWLLDIGQLSGCGHLDERLPSCIREHVDELQSKADLWERLHDARTREMNAMQAEVRTLRNWIKGVQDINGKASSPEQFGEMFDVLIDALGWPDGAKTDV